MNPPELIDKRIAELAGWRGQMFAQLRNLIHEADPNIIEEWKWNTAVWSHNGPVCSVAASIANLFTGELLHIHLAFPS
ncbi:MAG TPA: DUF1801 domain-containing protein [Ktedonobacteraceae bacterium]|nr:DUF1801 domain-containing protein [Ktedonobacteraceae bacterium]